MRKTIFTGFFTFLTVYSFSQQISPLPFLSDSSLIHASVSLCVTDTDDGEVIMSYNPEKSLIPASVMKLITTAAALELLGPDYTFKTLIGYTGSIDKSTGTLTGNIIIRGGGDPSLGSKYFEDHYQDFMGLWVDKIINVGIKRINGRIITDDSYYDYQPVPARWLWEDAGNYYGAGAYGLSVFDNTYEIHLKTTSDSTLLTISGIVPEECSSQLTNLLIASENFNEGYVFAAPYSTTGWLAGTIPVNREDYVLKASVPDPPLLIAKMMTNRLEASGIIISEDPVTIRMETRYLTDSVIPITETVSPPLSEIIKVLNHESVNLFAEHLIKELGKRYKKSGSTAAGVRVISEFLNTAGILTDGMFIEDGSGLSPLNSINSKELVNLLAYMKNRSKYFPYYYASLPDAGKEGTLKLWFRDPVFEGRLNAKSGSMTRVRSYAGYFSTVSGKKMIFSIIINNYTGSSNNIISIIENILSTIILSE